MKKIIIAFLMILFTGCSVVPLGYEASTIPLTNNTGNNLRYDVLGKSEGSSGYFSLFGIIPFGSINTNQAVNEATNKLNGDALINPRYWFRQSFYFIGTYTNIEVKGDVIRIKKEN